MSAQSFLIKAIEGNGVPEITSIEIRQCKYLNNIVEQDHRHVKWKFQRSLGFKDFESAKRTIGGIEVVQMIKKNQVKNSKLKNYRTFCSLVG